MLKVILRQDVKRIGVQGEIVTVKDGFARNYLFPGGLAVLATAGLEKQVQKEVVATKKRMVSHVEKLKALASSLAAKTFTITVKTGKNDKLYGSVSEIQIVDAINAQAGLALEKHAVQLEAHLKEIGDHKVELSLGEGVMANVTISIVSESAPL